LDKLYGASFATPSLLHPKSWMHKTSRVLMIITEVISIQ
jgi:hypothetical protein